ncbi:MAG: hypothetical protein K2X34_12045, partial [Hyphomonadaceae bacterium]|nr:hypothetical protein [Hyphomonadaceae bacterium]
MQRLLIPGALGLLTLIGCIGAFVGLGVSSFWVDELFTGWVVGVDGDAAVALDRALQDVHPPLYYLSLFTYALPFGDSDVALRSFSAVVAVAAIGVFVVGCRGAFSLNGRLFAAALAVGSSFWFIQAQNVRSNALALLLGAAILALALSLLRREQRPAQRPATVAALLALIFFGAFTHFYMGYLGLAVLLVLAVMRPDFRLVMAGGAVLLVTAMAAYLKLVVEPLGQWLTGTSWMRSDVLWYVGNLNSARRLTLDVFATGAVGVCLALIALGRGEHSALARARAYFSAVARKPLRAVSAADPVLLFLLGVPAVLGGAIVSSVLLSPNFTDRSFLVVSPFLWALLAKIYDEAFERGSSRFTTVASGVLIALVAATAFVVQARAHPRNMPFRDAGAWIASFPECRGATIPVVLDAAGVAPTTKPGFLERIIPATRARYLPDMEALLIRA